LDAAAPQIVVCRLCPVYPSCIVSSRHDVEIGVIGTAGKGLGEERRRPACLPAGR